MTCPHCGQSPDTRGVWSQFYNRWWCCQARQDAFSHRIDYNGAAEQRRKELEIEQAEWYYDSTRRDGLEKPSD